MQPIDYLNHLIATKKYHDILAILKGFRNGAVYGAKIRFPHALVMTLLFRRDTVSKMTNNIFDLTFQHSRNLAFFVTIYKSLLYLQRLVKGREDSIDSFLAGCIGGYIIFGKNTNVNNQIVLYLLSRILVGLGSLLVKRKWVHQPSNGFTYMATIVWGIVMWLFRHDKDVLQGSLVSSMEYLYNDSDKFETVKNWIWHNR